MVTARLPEQKERNDFRDRVDAAVAAAGTNLSAVARRAGMKRNALGTVLRSGNPRRDTLLRIARAIPCDPGDLQPLVDGAAEPHDCWAGAGLNVPPEFREGARRRAAIGVVLERLGLAAEVTDLVRLYVVGVLRDRPELTPEARRDLAAALAVASPSRGGERPLGAAKRRA